MNLSNFSSFRTARLGFGFALAPLAVAVAFGAAGPVPADSVKTAAPKTHVLFVGADFSVEQNRKFYPVEDVTPTAIVIKPGSKTVNVPLDQGTNLLINESLKLAGTSVEISRLKFEAAYAVGSDPFDQLARSASLAASNTALADIARGEVMRANMGVMTASGPDRALAEAARGQAEANFSKAIESPVSQVYDVGAQSVKASGEDMFDAIRIRFAVTAETDIPQPYIGVIARFRDPSGRRDELQKWAYMEALGPMKAGVSRNVLVYRGGFPRGYTLEGCEVHFYRGKEELATNLARKRIELTDEEASEYRIIEYVSANPDRTAPAALATATLPADVRARLRPAQLDETCYARVAKNGRVVGLFHDAAGKRPMQDPNLDPLLPMLRFKPALQAGKPVESMAPLKLGELASP